jgi:cyclic pyranopterin phosphate synthase
MLPDCASFIAGIPDSGPLIDGHGRVHDSLRISVTDRCNVRCFYCMPSEGVPWKSHTEILRYEEIERLVRVAAALGVRKIRLTGGEPLIAKDLPVLIRLLVAIPGIQDVSLTTNGVLLADAAHALREAGLRRINVHLDTLDRQRYMRITRRDDLGRVLAGLHAARTVGFAPIKINAVAIRQQSEPDIVPLAHFGRENHFEVRFIEFMPLDSQGLWDRSRMLASTGILALLASEFGPLIPVPDSDPRSPSQMYRYADGAGQIGLINAVSQSFCRHCNRIRLTADGKLRSCLFATREEDVRAILREGTDREIAQALRNVLRAKHSGHNVNTPQFIPPPRPMNAIGG